MEVDMAGGYTGKYCIVDLSSGTTEVVEPGDAFYRKFLAGYGLGAAVITERQKPPGILLGTDNRQRRPVFRSIYGRGEITIDRGVG
jgi:hypothetical protein